MTEQRSGAWKLGDPALNPGDEEYFIAARSGSLLVGACRACGELHHYPRCMCPFCWSTEVELKPAAGAGTIYTFSVTRKGPDTPYCIAYVQLDEGPIMMTNIVGTDLDRVRVGQRVRLVCVPTGGEYAIPMFTPAKAE